MQSHYIESLMLAAQAGDESAFERIYAELFTPVYRYCYIRTRHSQTAEDIAQSVFLKAFEALPNYRQTGRPPLAWLFTIARNMLTDWYRKNDTAQTDFLDEAVLIRLADSKQHERADTAPTHAEGVDPILVFAIQELEPELYEIIQLKYIDGWHYQQIAVATGRSEQSIRQDVSRALRKLRTALHNNKLS